MLSDAAATKVSATAHTVSAWSLLAQLLIGLAVILVIIFVATRLLGGKGRRSIGAGRRRMPVSVLARQSMGKGVSIVIVQAGAATYLLGVTPHQVTRLDRLDPAGLDPAGVDPTGVDNAGSSEDRGGRVDTDLGDLSGPTSGVTPWDQPTPTIASMVRKLQDRSVRR